MVTQQVVTAPARAGLFLVMTIAPHRAADVHDALTEVSGFARSLSFRYPDADLSCVIGIGATAWDRLFDTPRPAHLHPFTPVAGPVHSAPATPGDILVHVRAARTDLCYEMARQITDRLGDAVRVEDEVHGFSYLDNRDLLGFVDGTENPTGQDALDAVLVGDDDPDHAGGSYVIVQKYVHDLTEWQALGTHGQEQVIGRSKLDDVEMADDVKPPDSHIALTVIEDADGNEREIFRANMPFGSFASGEFGTYFIGYAADPDVIETMLRAMFQGDDEGHTDRILDVSTAVTGGLFFVPAVGMLDDPPPVPDAAPTAPVETPEPVASTPTASTPVDDGNLRIGGLRDGHRL